ncbi:MAG: glutathione S-transferase [Pseudomonadota bacterium]|nr:glutathione S-transferase [Pseudomonadota bacterium]
MGLPILYSFRRCPYAMRARLAILASGLCVELREVVLRAKPPEMLLISPKGTVPVLQLPNGQVIEQSLEIMCWALQQQDPAGWLPTDAAEQAAMLALIAQNDQPFKANLDRYKYPNRYPEQNAPFYRSQGELFLAHLEARLTQHTYLWSNQVSLADVAIFPFVRQFAQVDRVWFDQAAYPRVQAWLAAWLDSPLFAASMTKYDAWQAPEAGVLFGVCA